MLVNKAQRNEGEELRESMTKNQKKTIGVMPIAGSQITGKPDEETIDAEGKASLAGPSAAKGFQKDNAYDSERIRLHEHKD